MIPIIDTALNFGTAITSLISGNKDRKHQLQLAQIGEADREDWQAYNKTKQDQMIKTAIIIIGVLSATLIILRLLK